MLLCDCLRQMSTALPYEHLPAIRRTIDNDEVIVDPSTVTAR